MMDEFSIQDRAAVADMILVGLGEEFDVGSQQGCVPYMHGAEKIKGAGLGHLLPAWNEFCAEKQGMKKVSEALERLRGFLEGKNYFVVSVSGNSEISRIPWKKDRLVMPCGSALLKQCKKGCADILEEVSEEDNEKLKAGFEKLYAGQDTDETAYRLGNCPVCGSDMVLNNVYADCYNEGGYLEQWQVYKRWLQGTVNRKLLVLELGVGMRFPTVIRWPFEKVAYFNQKAFFCRVNKNLYQLTEELAGKGVGISQNAIDWLCRL